MTNRVKGEGSYDKHGNYIRFRITTNGATKEFFGKTKKEAHDKYLTYLDKIPYDKVKVPKRQDSKIRIFCKDDVNRIIEFAKSDKEFGLAILILLFTGLRRGEICALNWKDIDFDEGSIFIHQTVSIDETGSILKSTTKTDNDRIIAIPTELYQELNKYRNKSGCVIAPKEKFCKLKKL